MCDLLRINTDRGVMIHDNEARFSIRGQPIYHFVGTSTFSEYTVVHAGCVAKVNAAAPLDKICILSCGICTGLEDPDLEIKFVIIMLVNIKHSFSHPCL